MSNTNEAKAQELRIALVAGAQQKMVVRAQDQLLRTLTNSANNHESSWCDSNARDLMQASLEALMVQQVCDDVRFDVIRGTQVDCAAVTEEMKRLAGKKIDWLVKQLQQMKERCEANMPEMVTGLVASLQKAAALAD